MPNPFQPVIPIFIGFDPRQRAAANVLIDSLNQHSSKPLAITPLVKAQLEAQGFYWRECSINQSTPFSFTRFLVPHLMSYQGWAIFMDCDMLCRGDINNLWAQRDDNYTLLCVQQDHQPSETRKFLGEAQIAYTKKNWSSLMLLNCGRCTALTPEHVSTASGINLHQFHWLPGDHEIGAIQGNWNHLVDVQPPDHRPSDQEGPALVHWTLGGPWLPDFREAGGPLAAEWHASHRAAYQLA